MSKNATCSDAVCIRKTFAKGLCSTHYRIQRDAAAPPCMEDGCNDKSRTRGMCTMHYERWKKSGDQESRPVVMRKTEKTLFIDKAISSDTDDCIIWPWTLLKGYGRYTVDGREWPSHRFVLIQTAGEPPQDGIEYQAAHAPSICHNRACINPKHLRWATRSENAADMVADDTHTLADRNARATITNEQAREIFVDPRPYAEIRKQYPVSDASISRIKNRVRWLHATQSLVDAEKQ